VSVPSAAALRRAMVEMVAADEIVRAWRGPLAPWLPSLRAVPRHAFLPDTVWVDNEPGGDPPLVPLHREQDPQRWLSLAYGGDGVATQVDDGLGGGAGGSLPSSSASGPAIVAVMLAALDAQPGERVLEIGTGTGYNAALLAHRLGAEQVTSVEVDPAVAGQARAALAAAGYGDVCTVVGDGALGYPPGAPFDRVIATVGVHDIPHAWVKQTRPGGRLVLPWANTYAGGLVALTVAGDGTATGSIVAESSFMWLRGQRATRGAVQPPTVAGTRDPDDVEQRTTTLHPHDVTGPHGARIAIAQRVPGCQWRYWPWDEQEPVGVLWLVDPWGSWAKLTHSTPDASEDEFAVLQSGPRRLWDETEDAHRWWVDHDRPGAERWRFTVTPSGQRIALTE
jgi:protein-L-isoaspartate(D-aspartate) O-methyltransferase